MSWEYFRKSEGRWYSCHRKPGNRRVFSRRRAVHVWEEANGPKSRDIAIHHINGDKTDDRLENLRAMPRHEHELLHGKLRADHKDIDGTEHRRCQRCQEYRPLSCFSVRKAGTYHGYCQECVKGYLREWRDKNREHINAQARAYRRNGNRARPESILLK